MHGSFLSHRGGFWFWVALVLVLSSVLAYVWHEPLGQPNGGTWLGYTLGTVAALLIVWLTFFGVRKRAYYSRLGTVKGWLSAHVYLGGSLLVLGTLHSGFQFGLNIHTLAWLLMVLVIVSGFYGVWVYWRYPERITRNRDGMTRQLIFREVADIDRKASVIVEGLGSPADRMVISAIQLFSIGGGAWHQLTGRDRSRIMVAASKGSAKRWVQVANPTQQRLLDELTGLLSRSADPQEAALLQELIDLISRKAKLMRQLLADIRLQGLMEVWLYCHIPLTMALLATLMAHIVSVFFYW
ncbi:hypothetical protein [Alcanivorax sp. 1008]|uniref:hypothetical protein n=1 Tax=Alcanivorax sp. 1008 TaxID=2816853 RepID=UPI001DA50CCE|nr:hypothetical protein [Alcanivorax sp. 1008]MCC1497810.1 hypothetical protein [Alcanivorax sp. 1008]